MSFGKNKSKTSQKTDQTATNTLSNRASGMLTQGINDLSGRSYQGFDPASLSKFQNPYQDQVRDATLAQMDYGNQQDFNNLNARLATSKAFGDDRRGIIESELAGQQGRDRASMLAGLNSQGFDKSMGAALGENQNANQFDLQLQALINQLRGGFTSEGTQTSKGTSSGKTSGMNLGFSWSPLTGFGG